MARTHRERDTVRDLLDAVQVEKGAVSLVPVAAFLLIIEGCTPIPPFHPDQEERISDEGPVHWHVCAAGVAELHARHCTPRCTSLDFEAMIDNIETLCGDKVARANRPDILARLWMNAVSRD